MSIDKILLPGVICFDKSQPWLTRILQFDLVHTVLKIADAPKKIITPIDLEFSHAPIFTSGGTGKHSE